MKQLKFFVAVCSCIHLVEFSYSARILGILNFEMLSHFRFHETMMKSLATAGHHITMIGPYDLQHPHENITAINTKAKNPRDRDDSLKSFARANLIWLQVMIEALELLKEDCYNIISLIEEKNLKNFDIMFVEVMPMYECFLPLAKKMEIPIIGTLSSRSFVNLDLAVGHQRNPAVLPTELFFVNVKMSFYERLINLVNEIQIRIGHFFEEKYRNEIFNNLYPGKDFQNFEISLIFVNNHVSLEPKALAPNVVNIGGILLKSTKLNSLPQQFKKFIDEAEHGVILFSLGTLASSDTADPHLASILKNTFAKVPQRVIWKYNGTMEGVSDNVLITPWMPQKEILAHKNVIAFISHCGLSSTYEAIYFSKPMILLPVFAEQPSNAALLKHLGVGLYLDILKLTEQKLLDAIKEIISNKSYRLKMEQMSQKFKDEPKSPEELVVFWTEYVLRHRGATFIRSVTADIPLYQYLLLDVFAFVAVMSIFAVAFMYFLAKYSIFIFFRFLRKGIYKYPYKKTL